MQIPKPSESDKEQFRLMLADFGGIDIKPMFGNIGAFVNGNMFAGLFGATLGLRLSDSDRADLESAGPTVSFGPEERPMRGYVGIRESWHDNPPQAKEWLAKALRFVSEMPPKVPGSRKAK
jgi:TfoX/Sxy family transcriptional regulator of competence genes